MTIRRRIATLLLAVSIAIGGSQALANQDLFAELEQAAQDVRQLELLEPIDVEVITREEHRAAQLESIQEDIEAEGAGDWNVLLIFIGFIEEDQDIYEIYNSFVSEQVLGTYDPETKQLIVISSNTDEWNTIDKITFVHETVHALQDQHFDIMTLYGDEMLVTDDSFYAIRSLIEGDASVAELIYVLENDLVDQLLEDYENMESVSTDDVPFFLMETMPFFYDEGATFVSTLWRDGGWDAVNDAWSNPPTTSEQIIHPEKYLEGEGANPVKIADPQPLFGDEWRIIEDNAWGELGTRVFLENSGASTRSATSAAEGWGGDGVYVITNDEESAMVWSTAWDTEEDSIEFFETLAEAEATRLGVEVEHVDGNTLALTGNGWFGEIHRDGDTVVFFLTQSEDSLAMIIESQAEAPLQSLSSPVAETRSAPGGESLAFWIREI